MKRRVVITGLGAITPIGNTVTDTWEAVQAGKCGIAPITQYDSSNQKVHLAAEVKDLPLDTLLDKKVLRTTDRYSQFALITADEAVKDAGLDMSQENAARVGVVISTGIGGLSTIEKEHARGLEKGFDRVSPHFIPMVMGNSAAGQVAIAHGCKGKCISILTACASGNNAIGDAFREIRDGYADVMLAGGTEAIVTPMAIGGFTVMRALNTTEDPNRASIPFDKERSGFVLGEGAGVLVLEELEHAKARGAKIHGELVGFAANCDAYDITAPSADGAGGAACMTLALEDAGIAPEDVDYINAHGTSTPMNDRCETNAIKTAFGDHAYKLAVSSTKAMTGHLLGGAGAIEAVITTKAVEDGFIPATIHYQVPDEDCDLDIVPNEGRKQPIRYALSNALGFGGHNAAIIIKHYEED